MSDWVTRAYSKNSTPVVVDEALLDEEVVILLQGNNAFGDPIYSYIKMTLRNLMKLKTTMRGTKNFLPSDFGSVLYAGKGEPTPELRSEMAVTYGLIEVPKPIPPKINTAQPSMWEDDS